MSLALALGALAFFAFQLKKSWPQVAALSWHAPLILALTLSVIWLSAQALIDGCFWGFSLRSLGVPARAREAVRVLSLAQFAKYLPGNVGQLVGRVTLGKEYGWRSGGVITSLFVENIYSIGVGALIACEGLALAGAGAPRSSKVLLGGALLVLGWAAGVFLLKLLLARPPKRVATLLGLSGPLHLRASYLVIYVGAHLMSYSASFVSLTAIFAGLLGHWPPDAWKIPAAAAVSWLAGYVVPGAPAGLGVREATLTALLGSSLGEGTVVAAALVWRLSTLLSDALVFGIGLSMRRPPARASGSAQP